MDVLLCFVKVHGAAKDKMKETSTKDGMQKRPGFSYEVTRNCPASALCLSVYGH